MQGEAVTCGIGASRVFKKIKHLAWCLAILTMTLGRAPLQGCNKCRQALTSVYYPPAGLVKTSAMCGYSRGVLSAWPALWRKGKGGKGERRLCSAMVSNGRQWSVMVGNGGKWLLMACLCARS